MPPGSQSSPDARRPSPLRPAGDVQEALAYHAQLRRAGARELQQEQELARRIFLKSADDRARMRYALAMTMPGAATADVTRALDALDPLTRNAEAPLHGLALLLSAQLQEQRRSEMQVQALQHKLDALLELERSMTSRDSGSIRKK
ncbi:MAG: hypothetical protein K2W84_17220 [Burkholderiales bacterium]|nr:hypothetical protein [Burkholderiales bacterium]